MTIKHRSHAASGKNLIIGVLLLLAAGGALAGIFNTKHNLGSTGINAASQFSGTREICVFCHTPAWCQ